MVSPISNKNRRKGFRDFLNRFDQFSMETEDTDEPEFEEVDVDETSWRKIFSNELQQRNLYQRDIFRDTFSAYNSLLKSHKGSKTRILELEKEVRTATHMVTYHISPDLSPLPTCTNFSTTYVISTHTNHYCDELFMFLLSCYKPLLSFYTSGN